MSPGTPIPLARFLRPAAGHAERRRALDAPTVLAVGAWDRTEFRLVRDGLDSARRWPTAATLADAVTSGGPPPEVVLLALPRPGRLGQEDIDRVRAAWPLARVVIVAGSWCEGELRSGRPPTGAVRLYWHEFGDWWRAACAAWARSEAPPWSEPLDDLRGGQTIAVTGAAAGNAAAGLTLAIHAADCGTFEATAASLAGCGWQCCWHHSGLAANDFAALLWNGGQLDERELGELAAFCAALSPRSTPVLVLLDYPRAEHIAAIRDAGAQGLLGKPYQAALVDQQLRRMLQESSAMGS
jgi:hypothetical protein